MTRRSLAIISFRNDVLVGNDKVTGVKVQKLCLVGPDLGHILGIPETARERVDIVEPYLRYPVVLYQRETRELDINRVLLNIAANRLPDSRDSHEEGCMPGFVIFNKLLEANRRLTLEQNSELDHGASLPVKRAGRVASIARLRISTVMYRKAT